MSAATVIDEAVSSQLCAGCGACAAIAPNDVKMDIDGNGHLRPRVSGAISDPISDPISGAISGAVQSRIRDVCPGLSMTMPASDRETHPLWGPYRSIADGWARDPALRRRASSGGGLSALLVHMLDSGAASFIHQTAAAKDDPLGNKTVASHVKGDITEAAGSRYAPSAPLADLEASLARGKPFVFVGKPCDVAALRAMARHDPRINEHVALVVSFFCAGAPSRKGGDALLDAMNVTRDDVVAFRYRGDGWPGKARARLASGEEASLSYEQSWGDVLSKHLPFRCKICPDGVGGFADIVFADAWRCDERGYPLFEETDGVSLIVTRTEKGEAALAAAVDAGVIETAPRAIEDILDMQPGQRRRKTLALSRIAALWALGRRAPRFKGFQLLKAAARAGVFANIKSFLGAGRRIVLNLR
ncbi:MAG: Coenzyme F420 hydrogenase/dehydrogenase, beta subunit C-terminal domain [Pseudomonadota bacterium]